MNGHLAASEDNPRNAGGVFFDECRNLVSQLVQHERIETTVPKVSYAAMHSVCFREN